MRRAWCYEGEGSALLDALIFADVVTGPTGQAVDLAGGEALTVPTSAP
ncbi:hypothetical protein [Streptomyces sp. NPDC020607]